jgi:hypothetical protein
MVQPCLTKGLRFEIPAVELAVVGVAEPECTAIAHDIGGFGGRASKQLVAPIQSIVWWK